MAPETEVEKQPSSAEAVLSKFKKQFKTVEYEGEIFRIKKLPATAVMLSGLMSIPFAKEVFANWSAMSKEEKTEKVTALLKDKDAARNMRDANVVMGVESPKFSNEDPAPEGSLKISEMDEPLLDFLSDEVIAFSNLDKQAGEFFRSDSRG